MSENSILSSWYVIDILSNL